MCENGESCVLAFLSYRAVVCKWGCTFWRVIRNKNKNRWLGSTPRDSDLIGLALSGHFQSSSGVSNVKPALRISVYGGCEQRGQQVLFVIVSLDVGHLFTKKLG